MSTKKNTLIKHGDKEYSYYRITRTIGHKMKDGKRVPIKKQFTGTSKGNAEKKFKEWQEEQLRQKLTQEQEKQELQSRSFQEYAEEFTYKVLPEMNYTEGTKKQYEHHYRTHIRESTLSEIPISEIKPNTIQKFYNELQSRSVLAGTSKWMSAFFKWLSLNDYAPNVLPAVKVPKRPAPTKEIVVWEQEEIKTILKASDSFPYRFMIILMYYAGLRISECLGLKYGDFKDNMIHIERQCYHGNIQPPKSRSNRTVPMHPVVADELAKHKERSPASEYVFVSSSGRLLDYYCVRRSFQKFYAQNSILEKKLHAYRATFCTELCRAGVPLEVASKLMGHKSITVTARHYALVKKDVQIDAISRLPVF